MGFIFLPVGLEPIAVELSGGQFLPPVQTLVATSIFCHRQKMQIESGHRAFFPGHRNRTPAFPPHPSKIKDF